MADRCTFVNPLCPTDLCVLEYGHPWASRGRHVTGTTRGSAGTSREEQLALLRDPVQTAWSVGYLAPRGTSDEDLARLGCEAARAARHQRASR